MRFRYPVAVALVVTAISVPTASAASCTWTPTQLPLPATFTSGTVDVADSQSGYAGSASRNGETTHVVRWVNGQVVDYGTVPGYGPHAFVAGVNKSGTVVGHTNAATGNRQRAFRSVGTTLEVLPEPAGAEDSYANGINDAGDIVGEVGNYVTIGSSSYFVRKAVLWPASAPGTVVQLTAGLPSTGQTLGKGIDQDGTVLVQYYPSLTSSLNATALYLWKAGTARQLPTPVGNKQVDGRAISNGRVAGASSPGGLIGTVWDQNGTLINPVAADLLTSINRTGQTVGWKVGSGLSITYSVWQGTAKVGTFSGAHGLYVSADDGSVAGWSRFAPDNAIKPAYWRCQ